MPYLSKETHQRLCEDPSRISHVWNSAAAAFRLSIGPILASKHVDMVAAAFCSIVAYDMKPYGPCVELELSRLLASPVLDCDNYCVLTWHLWHLLNPQPYVDMVLVGWDGGAVGNHAQLLIESRDKASSWLLDPTIGLIAAGATYDKICRGEKVTFFSHPAGVRDVAYANRVKWALSNGLYKPSDLLYYFDPPSRYIDLPRSAYWATPRAN